MNDPIVKAIHGLIDHSVSTDQRLEMILAQLKKMGVELHADAESIEKFDPNYLNKIVD